MKLCNLAFGQTIISKAFPKKLKISNDSGNVGLIGGKKANDAFKYLRKLLDKKELKGLQKKKYKIKVLEVEIQDFRAKTYDVLDDLVTYIDTFWNDVDEYITSQEEVLGDFMSNNVVRLSSRKSILLTEFAGADVVKIPDSDFSYNEVFENIDPPKKMIFSKDARIACVKGLKLPEELHAPNGDIRMWTNNTSKKGINTKVIKSKSVHIYDETLKLLKNTAITTDYLYTAGSIPLNLTADVLEISESLTKYITIPTSIKIKKLIGPRIYITNFEEDFEEKTSIKVKDNGPSEYSMSIKNKKKKKKKKKGKKKGKRRNY